MQLYLPIADIPVNVFLILAMGAAVGFVSGMFGIGGGFLMTPLLIFVGIAPAVLSGPLGALAVEAIDPASAAYRDLIARCPCTSGCPACVGPADASRSRVGSGEIASAGNARGQASAADRSEEGGLHLGTGHWT